MVKIKNMSSILKIAFFINIGMVVLWFLISFALGGDYDPWVFLDFIFPFSGLYLLVIFFFSLKLSSIKEKMLLSYLSIALPLTVFGFILIASFEKASIILFSVFLVGPVFVSMISYYLGHLFKKIKSSKKTKKK